MELYRDYCLLRIYLLFGGYVPLYGNILERYHSAVACIKVNAKAYQLHLLRRFLYIHEVQVFFVKHDFYEQSLRYILGKCPHGV